MTVHARAGDDTPHSLRRRLLGLVLAAILLATLALGVATYRGALRQADALFDLHLRQMAQALRWGVPAGGLADSEDDGTEVLVQIWGLDGTLVFRSGPAPLPQRAVLGYSDAEVAGRRWRIYTLHTPLQTVQIAQDRDARQARARTLALQATLPMALMAPLLMLAVGWIITRSLAPVERMRRQVAARTADDFSALPEQGLPQEVRPLVHELNLLFGRLGAAFAAQKDFVADAAHELRSPLAALRLQVQGLRRAADSNDAVGRDAATLRLQQGIERAIRLVGQMLVLARQEAGGEAVPLQPVPLHDLLQEAVGTALPQANARGIDLGLGTVEPVAVQGRRDELLVLLTNLVDNAAKYTPPGGQVDLSLALDAGAPVLAVEDSGPGIPEAQRERAFDRFHRLGHGDADATGSGLGLAIVRAVAQRHGATVCLATSARLGGLRAEVRWPAAAALPQAGVAAPPP